ncbi:flagellar export protein FliJ [Gracilibacillus sp. S3-1-1]|uniref:Flagellar export protein FliJ n=1 Tax=Gracilibacillus pellucidus TaxID=3095368 RepID=A0ACC6M7T9_9BACI|nr:flagellar export protein FliJ [Gracilibacillus sp. S3-1-1]MDX8046938.1 flagellar export protein FliJ [Gracilibacillus sp. S3-1-1]
MTQLHGYEKIRMLRENEKMVAQQKYQGAAAEFEKNANQLYDLLRKKELVEENYRQSLSDKSAVNTLQSYHQYLDFLMPSIISIQRKVDVSRKEMNRLQENVTEQYIEEKKITKIIERKKRLFKQEETKKESMLMDEVSIRNYIEK